MSLCFCRVHIQIHYVVISVKQSEIPAKQPSSLQQLTAERPRASSAAAVCVSSARALRAVLRLRSPDSREPETQHVCHVICAPCAACSCQVNRQKTAVHDTTYKNPVKQCTETCTLANDNAPVHALRPGFLSTFALATDQGSKLGLSKNKSIICYYNTYQIVQFNRLPLVISFIASSSANTGLIMSLEKELAPLIEELRQVVEVT
ncbi:Ragulator complex protein LAMTOR3 [Larimichthys crocea]|uniref:Uncharacterized protein n=1 Tax=Larimichthys crocea TaxID=215358 RepID=A0ACD3RNH2_LARCR|nr:Ragulator complex protein LAMTOR3 [Larimichthys crocea]